MDKARDDHHEVSDPILELMDASVALERLSELLTRNDDSEDRGLAFTLRCISGRIMAAASALDG